MLRLNKFILTSIFLISINQIVFSQSQLKLGLGSFVILGNNTLAKVEGFSDFITVKNPYGFSINMDYMLNSSIKVKSGLEYKFQTLKPNNNFTFNAEFFSIPLLLDYKIIDKSKFKISLSTGFSFDKLVYYSNNYYYSSTNETNTNSVSIMLTTSKYFPQKALHFNSISLRFGSVFSKKIGRNSEINVFAYYIPQLNNRFSAEAYFIRTSKPSPGLELTLEYDKEINLSHHGFQIGVYYTFGTLVFKQP